MNEQTHAHFMEDMYKLTERLYAIDLHHVNGKKVDDTQIDRYTINKTLSNTIMR